MNLSKIAKRGPWDTKREQIDVQGGMHPNFMTNHFGNISSHLSKLQNVPKPAEFGHQVAPPEHFNAACVTQVKKEGLLADHYLEAYGRGKAEDCTVEDPEPAYYEGVFLAYERIVKEIRSTPPASQQPWMLAFNQSFYEDITENMMKSSTAVTFCTKRALSVIPNPLSCGAMTRGWKTRTRCYITRQKPWVC